jgi:uncharacterized membrane protein (DUF485 family)
MSEHPGGGGTAPRPDDHQLETDILALAAKRLKVSVALTVGMLVVYFGFILLVAFNKKGLGTILTDGLSLGILLGVLVILATWALTWFYVAWANRVYEPEISRLKR